MKSCFPMSLQLLPSRTWVAVSVPVVLLVACRNTNRPGSTKDASIPDAQPDTAVYLDAGADAQIYYCGETLCPALPPPPPRFQQFASHCCTIGGGCGVGNSEYFGDECFERDQPGSPSQECIDGEFILIPGDEDPAYVRTCYGCCRPDGLCGFISDAYLGAGCVEQNRFGIALSSGTLGFNNDIYFEQIACSFSQNQ